MVRHLYAQRSKAQSCQPQDHHGRAERFGSFGTVPSLVCVGTAETRRHARPRPHARTPAGFHRRVRANLAFCSVRACVRRPVVNALAELRNRKYSDAIFCARHIPPTPQDGPKHSGRPDESISSNAYDILLSVCCCPRECRVGVRSDER